MGDAAQRTSILPSLSALYKGGGIHCAAVDGGLAQSRRQGLYKPTTVPTPGLLVRNGPQPLKRADIE